MSKYILFYSIVNGCVTDEDGNVFAESTPSRSVRENGNRVPFIVERFAARFTIWCEKRNNVKSSFIWDDRGKHASCRKFMLVPLRV